MRFLSLNVVIFSDKLSAGSGDQVSRSATRRGILLLPPGRRPADPAIEYHRRWRQRRWCSLLGAYDVPQRQRLSVTWRRDVDVPLGR